MKRENSFYLIARHILRDLTMLKFHIFLAVFYCILLSNICWSRDADNLEAIRERKPRANQLQNVLDINDLTDGRILPTSKNDCVREIMGEIIFSKKLREGIDEKIKKGIEDAFEQNNSEKLLWVSLKVDIDRLSKESQKTDPNKFNLDIYATPDFGRTKITPVVLANEKGTDWQGRYIRQEILFIMLERSPVNLSLSVENIELSHFRFLGELATMLMERASEQNDIFPKIKPVRAARALNPITLYSKKRDLKALQTNHMRYFVQPKGYVSRCIDINLVTGEMLSYPGSHEKTDVMKATISSKNLQEIRDILTSKEFVRVSQQNNRFGMDGSSNIIEVDIDGSYLWKIHWVTEDIDFINALNKLGEVFRQYGPKFGTSLQRGNPGGNFN